MTKLYFDLKIINFNFSFLVFLILIYLFIFQPPFMPKLAFVGFFLLWSFFVYLRYGLPYFKKFKLKLYFLFFIIFFPLLIDGLQGEIVYSDRFIYWFLQSFVFSYFIVLYALNKNINLLATLYFVALLAASTSILSFWFPSVDNFFTNILDDAIYDHYSSFEIRYRAFGFSEHLTFSYGLVMAFFAGISLLMSRQTIFYIFFIPVFLFANLINARVGILVFFIFVIIFLLQSLGKVKGFFSLFLVFLFGLFTFIIFYEDITHLWESWYFGALRELYNLFTFSGENSTINKLFVDFIVIPDSLLPFLFGTGKSIFTGEGLIQNSDVGFILQLNYAGFIYTILLYIFVLLIFYNLVRTYGLGFWFAHVFLLTFLVMNTKGFFFAGIPGTRLLFLLYFYFLLKHYFELDRRCLKIKY